MSFSSLFFKKTESECYVITDDDWQPVEEPWMLWYQMLWTRPSVRKCKQHPWWWRTCVRVGTRYTEMERERWAQKDVMYYSNNNHSNQLQQPTLTKGYKFTLCSDYLRPTALYTIYRNSPNLGCLKGRCQYSHYTTDSTKSKKLV